MKTLKKYFAQIDTILIFLILECLVLMGFALGGINIIYYYLGFIIALFAIPYIIVFTSKKEALQLLYVAVPLVILAGLLAFGGYAQYYMINSTNSLIAGFENVGVFFAIIGFFFLGYGARRIKKFKIETALLCIGGSMALYVLISTFLTWGCYGMFYTLRFRKTPFYFYNGDPYDILVGSRSLIGFGVETTDLRYIGFFQVMLLSAFPALFFVNPKKDWKRFVIILSIGLVGFLSAFTFMNYKALLFVVPMLIIALGYRYYRNEKKFLTVIKWIVVGIVAFLGVLLLFAIINATGATKLSSFISGNKFLDRLFNSNRVMADINAVINAVLNKDNIKNMHWLDQDKTILLQDTGSIEFEVLKDGGFFAFIPLLFLMFITYFSVKNYMKKSKDSNVIKSIIFAFFVLYFCYTSFFYCCNQYIYVERAGEYQSIFRSLPFLICLFMIGYTFYPLHENVTPLIEDEEYVNKFLENDKKEEVIDENDDYNFTEPNSKKDAPDVTISEEKGEKNEEAN